MRQGQVHVGCNLWTNLDLHYKKLNKKFIMSRMWLNFRLVCLLHPLTRVKSLFFFSTRRRCKWANRKNSSNYMHHFQRFQVFLRDQETQLTVHSTNWHFICQHHKSTHHIITPSQWTSTWNWNSTFFFPQDKTFQCFWLYCYPEFFFTRAWCQDTFWHEMSIIIQELLKKKKQKLHFCHMF